VLFADTFAIPASSVLAYGKYAPRARHRPRSVSPKITRLPQALAESHRALEAIVETSLRRRRDGRWREARAIFVEGERARWRARGAYFPHASTLDAGIAKPSAKSAGLL